MQVQFPGPSGSIEGEMISAQNANGSFAVLCHPHPQYGGNMHDAVIDICAQVLTDHGVNVLKFNFRGVGGSSGVYSGGHAESADVVAAAQWLRLAHKCETLLLAGYSFGANMVWRAIDDTQPLERVLLIAPPVGHMEFATRQLTCPVEVFAGDADEFIDQAALAAWSEVSCHTLPGADHFFSGAWDMLRDRIEAVLGSE